MFDAQAWFVRDVILDHIQLPDLAARAEGEQSWLAEYEQVKQLITR